MAGVFFVQLQLDIVLDRSVVVADQARDIEVGARRGIEDERVIGERDRGAGRADTVDDRDHRRNARVGA